MTKIMSAIFMALLQPVSAISGTCLSSANYNICCTDSNVNNCAFTDCCTTAWDTSTTPWSRCTSSTGSGTY